MKRENGSGTLYRRGGKGPYYIKIEVAGKIIRKSTKTEDKAEALRQLEVYAKGHQLSDAERLAVVKVAIEERQLGASPTLDEAWTLYVKHPKNANQSADAQATDLGRWKAFTRWIHGYDGGPRCRINCRASHPEVKTLADVTQDIASEFIAAAKLTASACTVNRYTRVCDRVWTFAKARSNPWKDFGKVKGTHQQKRALSIEEVRRVIGSASGELRTLLTIGVYTGARLGDAVSMRWEKFDMERQTVRLKPHKTQYSSAIEIELPLHPDLVAALGTPKERGPVLPERSTWPRWKVDDEVQAHFARCGLDESIKPDGYKRAVAVVGFHSFRSTFISLMADAGAPLAMVQALVGHMSPELTQRYYRAETERARARVVALPAIS